MTTDEQAVALSILTEMVHSGPIEVYYDAEDEVGECGHCRNGRSFRPHFTSCTWLRAQTFLESIK